MGVINITLSLKGLFVLYGVSILVFAIDLFNEACIKAPDHDTHGEPVLIYGLYDVVRVIDANTIVISKAGEDTTVRLIGIAILENVESKAFEYVKSLLTGAQVYIEYDVVETDNYGRTLAYVYLEDGTFLNRLLIDQGLATAMIIQPNSKCAGFLYEASTEARLANKHDTAVQ